LCRFYFPFGTLRDGVQLETALQAYQVTGGGQVPLQPDQLGWTADVQQQLEALGTINNITDKIPRLDGKGFVKCLRGSHFPGCFVTCMKLSEGKFYSLFLRMRLCGFLLEANWCAAQRLLQAQLQDLPGASAEVMVGDEGVVPADVRRDAESQAGRMRRRRLTLEELQQEFGVDATPATNQAGPLTKFQMYRFCMLERGSIVWAKHCLGRDVFVLNDYDSQTSQFQEHEFVLVEVTSSSVTCTCDIYKILATTREEAQVSCLHVRFMEDAILPLLGEVQKAGFVPLSPHG
jgi:hypothetical protein